MYYKYLTLSYLTFSYAIYDNTFARSQNALKENLILGAQDKNYMKAY